MNGAQVADDAVYTARSLDRLAELEIEGSHGYWRLPRSNAESVERSSGRQRGD